jgi:hypothetical protein
MRHLLVTIAPQYLADEVAVRLPWADRMAIAWRFAYHAQGRSAWGSTLFALSDPIGTLNPVYHKPCHVRSLLQQTAMARSNAAWARRLAKLRASQS